MEIIDGTLMKWAESNIPNGSRIVGLFDIEKDNRPMLQIIYIYKNETISTVIHKRSYVRLAQSRSKKK